MQLIGVHERPHRVFDVLTDMAGGLNVDAEPISVGLQHTVDSLHHLSRFRLVVDRVEGGDEVELERVVERGDVLRLEGSVGQPPCRGLGAASRDGFVGKVEPDEARVRERLRHHIDRVSRASADVGHVDACLEPLDDAGHQRQCRTHEIRVEDRAGEVGHRFVEARVGGVGDTASVAELVDDFGFDRAGHRNELHETRVVVRARCPSRERRVLGWQHVSPAAAVVLDDAGGDHRAEPLAHIPFVETGGFGDLV